MVRPSIYNAFGDKETLFPRALERYRETVASTPLNAMDGENSIEAAMAAYFNQVVNYIAAEENPPRVPARPGRRSHRQPRCSQLLAREPAGDRSKTSRNGSSTPWTSESCPTATPRRTALDSLSMRCSR
jgi:AcrR family transcriptional regulator